MVSVLYCPKSSPNHFLSQNKNQNPILNHCVKFELNLLRNKKVTENPHYRRNKWPEIRNDVVFRQCLSLHQFFCCFEKFLAQMAELNRRGPFCPQSIIGNPVQNSVNRHTYTETRQLLSLFMLLHATRIKRTMLKITVIEN